MIRANGWFNFASEPATKTRMGKVSRSKLRFTELAYQRLLFKRTFTWFIHMHRPLAWVSWTPFMHSPINCCIIHALRFILDISFFFRLWSFRYSFFLFFFFETLQMITAVKRIAVRDDDIEQHKLIARLFDSIIKVLIG